MAVIEAGSWGLVEDEYRWKVAAGADNYLGPFIFADGEVEPDTPIEEIPREDLTGYTGGAQVRRRHGGEVIATCEVLIDGAAGEVLLWMPSDESRDWSVKWTSAVFDAELYAPGGKVLRLCHGSLAILPNVTREEELGEVEG